MLSAYRLPSGAHVELADDSEPIALSGMFAAELDGMRLRLRDADEAPLSMDALSLTDFHTLRVLLRRAGVVPERPIPTRCRNCHEEFRVVPSATFELGPYRDGELDDPDLDAPFTFDEPIALPEVEEQAAGDAAKAAMRLSPRTVGQAAPVHASVVPGIAFRFDAAIVEGLGIVELLGETEPARIAERLESLPDSALDVIVGIWEDAHYPPRLTAPHPCPACGATNWLPLPAERELSEAHLALEPLVDPPPGMLDFDAFEQMLTEEAERTYNALRVQEVSLEVVDGPAECDDAGEPLLGCYRPGDPEALPPHGPEVRIFYRTFAAMWREDGPYDVREEARVTIEHELEHHLAFLSGDDPVDDEERALIGEDLARRVGRREVQRRALRETRLDLVQFWSRTWFVWVLAAAATLLAVLADR